MTVEEHTERVDAHEPFHAQAQANSVICVNVLVITPSYYPCTGGLEVVVKEVTERLARKGHLCSILTLNTCGAEEEEVLNRVYLKRFSARISKRLFGLSPEMFIHAVRNRRTLGTIDIIHLHGYWSLLAMQMVFLTKNVLRAKPKLVLSPHYHAMGHTKVASVLHRILLPFGRWTLRQVDALICVSDYESSLLRHSFPVPRDKVWTIPNGVERIEARRKLKEEGQPISLLYVGRVERYKGVQYILRAMARLRTDYQVNSSLTIVGEGAYASELRDSITRLGLEASVRWLANLRTEELDREYEDADMLLLLSAMEAYGLVVAEALAHGTPCIVSNKSALAEFLNEPGCFGIDHPPNDDALANLISNVYNADVVVGQLSRKVRVWDDVVDDYVRVYCRTIET